MKLSPHFTLEEMTDSYEATRLGIDNSAPSRVMPNLRALAAGMEGVRALLGKPIHINSGYRCAALNAAIGGSKTSAHLKGFAADFICPAFGTPTDIVHRIQTSGVRFDQCILEGTWVHLSFDPRMRQQYLTAHFGPSGTTYTPGI